MLHNNTVKYSCFHRDNSIDLLKFICAVLVVFLHSHWKYEELFLPFTRCAVPCFLMISGYLLYDEKEGLGVERIKRSFNHVLSITIYATLFFFVWTEFVNLASNQALFVPSIEQMLDWILFNACPFGHHLWYLYAYLYVLLIVIYFERQKKLHILLYVSPILLLSDVLFGKYGVLLFGLDMPVVTLRNFFFVGIPYFCLGIILKKYYSLININRLFILGG